MNYYDDEDDNTEKEDDPGQSQSVSSVLGWKKWILMDWRVKAIIENQSREEKSRSFGANMSRNWIISRSSEYLINQTNSK